MKRLLLETNVSKIYMLAMIIVTLLIIGGYFSFSMFTVSKEKENAISIITGNLTYKLEVDGVESNSLTVGANTTKEFTITLSNSNNRVARFNFYYIGSLPSNVEACYKVENGYNTPPVRTGVNLEKDGSSGSSNTYIIKVTNNSSSSVTITLGVSVGLDYNDLSLPSNGHLFEEMQYPKVAEVLLANVGDNGDTYDDLEDTFITGEDPNNYIWYSGKLWRAVSVDLADNSIKMITSDTITTISYGSENNGSFASSDVKTWLNDTRIEGFLGNLRDYESFIKTDSKWQARDSVGNINSNDQIVTAPVGLLTEYEYTMSYKGASSSTGYLYNNIEWWLLSSISGDPIYLSHSRGMITSTTTEGYGVGVRPVVNLKNTVTIVDGSGTKEDPYRLYGDNDTNLAGTYLKDRYSGEYVSFGTGENNLYRIVSHEDGGTKITTAIPLTSNGTAITIAFNSDSAWNPVAYYESGRSILNNYIYETYQNTFLTAEQREMLLPMNLYYGVVGPNDSYLLAKYTDESATTTNPLFEDYGVGVLRLGELMTGSSSKTDGSYWLLTIYDSSNVRTIEYGSLGSNLLYADPTWSKGIKPVANLNANVIITSGTGIESDPFVLSVQK